jgi:hypothetical protein
MCYAGRYITTSYKRSLNIVIQMERILLFISGLFNDAVSSSDYKESRESAMIREIRSPWESIGKCHQTSISFGASPHFSPKHFIPIGDGQMCRTRRLTSSPTNNKHKHSIVNDLFSTVYYDSHIHIKTASILTQQTRYNKTKDCSLVPDLL